MVADGTQSQPIVFTSREDINDDGVANDSQGSARGQWGGLIINGNAPINSCATPATPESCDTQGEGGTGVYGGNNPGHNGGILRYVRVQYAGFQITPNNELNGIAFQGVGTGTTVDHIQVHNNDDDGVEFFGGTVNVRHVVVTGVDDDAFDWVAGWNGRAQDILTIGSGVGDNGFEGDNNATNNNVSPRSNPTISNFTLIGAETEDTGMLIREGSAATIFNGIVVGWDNDCLDVDNNADAISGGAADNGSTIALINSNPTLNAPSAGDLQISSVLFDCPSPGVNFRADSTSPVTSGDFPGVTEATNTLAGVLPGFVEANVEAINPQTVDPNFAQEEFIGAFEPGLAPSETWAFGWTVPGSVFPPQDCPTGTSDVTASSTVTAPSGGRVCELSGTVTQDVTLFAGNVYRINGSVFVGQDQGPDATAPLPGAQTATLTIQPGVTLFGANPTDFLVVNRGSRISASGVRNAPIVFTSDEDLNGQNTVGDERGQWGGLIINGRAPINSCSNPSDPASCDTQGEGGTGIYGGNAPNDNSGALNFVRVQFAGFQITPNNELNGIAFQGVGDATNLNFLQVHNNDDDGVEFFGGTANIKHVVITGVDDDAFDWVAGWNGKAQFILVAGSGAGDNGFEGDNNATNNNISPRSNPVIGSFTLIGGATEDTGMLLREGTAATIFNGVVAEWDNDCLDIDNNADAISGGAADNGSTIALINSSTTLNAQSTEDLQIVASYFYCPTPGVNFRNDAPSGVVAGDFPGVVDGSASNLSVPTGFSTAFVNGTLEDNVTPVNGFDPFFDNVTQIGALANDADDWYAGWTVPNSF